MISQMLHIFRNSPLGREVFLQSIYFSKKVNTQLEVYIPAYRQFIIYFKDKVVTVDLDRSFLQSRDSARKHVMELLQGENLTPHILQLRPEDYTSGSIPTLPTDNEFMCCPRTIRNVSTKIRFGYIGSKIRTIISSAAFPILVPSPVFKEWKSVTVFFGGSETSQKVVELGLKLSERSGFDLNIFTQAENLKQEAYFKIFKEKVLKVKKGIGYESCADNVYKFVTEDESFTPEMNLHRRVIQQAKWLFYNKGKFRHNLYYVPHDSLVVVGAHGHGIIKDMMFGSKMEIVQKTLANNLLIVGPKCADVL